MSFPALYSDLAAAGSSKEAVAVYKQLCEWLSKNSPAQEKKFPDFLRLLLKHMGSASSSVSISSLKICGFTLKHSPLPLDGRCGVVGRVLLLLSLLTLCLLQRNRKRHWSMPFAGP